jgi:hypothetical protein
MGDVIIDGNTGANRLVILDANGKIPALDGSNVTLLAGANFSTGTIPVARIDTGATAGKVVKLDGNAKLPAVSGAALTGVSGAIKNASDPTISTNPSGGVGTEWHNTTTGEVFICIDATAGANKWISTGGRSGDITPDPGHAGENYGFHIAGHDAASGRINTINKYSFTSDGNATDHGDCTYNHNNAMGASSKTDGFHIGGYGTTTVNTIGKFAFSSNTTAADHGDLAVLKNTGTGLSSPTHGYSAGGIINNGSFGSNEIQKFAFTSNTTASTVGTLHVAHAEGSSASSLTDGYIAGGRASAASPTVYLTTVRKYSFASEGNTTSHGDLVEITATPAGCSGVDYAIFIGGYSSAAPTMVDRVQKFAYASNTTASDVGDQAIPLFGQSGSASTTYAYSAGGANVSETRQNHIQKVAFSSGTNTTDIGDLTMIIAWGNKGDVQY